MSVRVHSSFPLADLVEIQAEYLRLEIIAQALSLVQEKL